MGEGKISELIDSRKSTGKTILMLVVLAGLGLVGLKFWHDILPFLIDVVYDTEKLLVGIAMLVATGLVLLNPRVHTILSYMLGSMSNWVINQFVDIDSVGILRTYVRRMKQRAEEMLDIIGSVRGQRDHVKKSIDTNEEKRVQNLQRARQAQKLVQQGGENVAEYKGAFTLSSRQAGRLKKSNMNLSSLLAKQEKLLKGLEAMYQAATVMQQDLESEIEVQVQEYEVTKLSFKGITRGMQIMAQDGPERELAQASLDSLSSKCDDMLGKMDMYMDVSRGLITGVDLDNMMFDENALKDLEDWERDHAGGAGLSTPPLAVRVGTDDNVRIGEVQEEASPDSFNSLFKDSSK